MVKLIRAWEPPNGAMATNYYDQLQLRKHGYLYLADENWIYSVGKYIGVKSLATGKRVILVREWTEEADDGEKTTGL